MLIADEVKQLHDTFLQLIRFFLLMILSLVTVTRPQYISFSKISCSKLRTYVCGGICSDSSKKNMQFYFEVVIKYKTYKIC